MPELCTQRRYWQPDVPDTTEWKVRHEDATLHPTGAEMAIADLLRGWLLYAQEHERMFESKIGDDQVLGPAWADMGMNIRRLFDGETGRYDCGTLDAIVCKMLTDQGFDPDTL